MLQASWKVHSVNAHRVTAHPARSDGAGAPLSLCETCRLDNRDFGNGIIPKSGASTWRMASLTHRATSRSIGFVALQDITFPVLGVDMFTQRQFGDVAKTTAPKGLRLAAPRALSPLSLSSPCLRVVCPPSHLGKNRIPMCDLAPQVNGTEYLI